MSQKTLPDLRAMSRRLAAHNDRVARYVEALPRRVDKLVEATLARDWIEVRRLSEFLACSSDIFGCLEVAQAAQSVCQEVDEPDNEVAVKRSVIRLISSCGALPEQVAAESVSSIDMHPAEPVASGRVAEGAVVTLPVSNSPIATLAVAASSAPVLKAVPAPSSAAKPSPQTKHSYASESRPRAPRRSKNSSRSAH